MSSIGQGGPNSPLREEWPAPIVVLEALSRFVPPETIRAVLTQAGRHNQRIRRLPATAVVWLVIAIGIWTDLDIPAIFRQVVGTLRSLLLVMLGNHPPCQAALSQARTRLGACCMRQLFLRTAAPLAGSLLRKVPQGSLVLWDRGFNGYRSLDGARRHSVHVVGRVGDHVVFEPIRTLEDGSYLAVIYPSGRDRRHRVNGMIVRVIDYTLDDPKRPGHGERHRLVTTLLEADAFPATELVVLYHERWEIEIGND